MNTKRMDYLVHDRPPRYGAHLLRYWQVRSDRPGRPGSWRFSLEEAGSEQRRGFPDLGALLAYLERELGRGAACGQGAGANQKE